MWLIFALLNPISEGSRSLFVKKASRGVNSLVISWFNNVIPLILFTPGIFLLDLQINTNVIIGVTGSAVINVVAAILYMRAIQHDNISKVMPILSFTPLFLLVTSPLMVGEVPNKTGLLGIILLVIGSYILNLGRGKRSFLDPITGLFREKGTRYMFIVAVIWSLSANLDKISINNSNVYQHIILVNVVIFVLMTIVVGSRGLLSWQTIRPEIKNLSFVSLFTTGSFVFHMIALSMTLVAYVVALKRLSGLVAVLLGHFFLKEPNIRERFLGALIMFLGVLFILLA